MENRHRIIKENSVGSPDLQGSWGSADLLPGNPETEKAMGLAGQRHELTHRDRLRSIAVQFG